MHKICQTSSGSLTEKYYNDEQQQVHHHNDNHNHHEQQQPHWSDFLNYNKSRKKKTNSRSKSMFEITDNPYADENCCCCNNNNNSNHSSTINGTTTSSINSSLIYSLLTASTLNHNNQSTSSNSLSTLATSSSFLFLLKFSHLLVSCGAPSHRLDNCLQLLMEKFDIKAQFGYFPGFLVVSFGDIGTLSLLYNTLTIKSLTPQVYAFIFL
jgi:hypothetical protein